MNSISVYFVTKTMDVYRNTICLFLLVSITQTVVKSRSIISPPDLENKKTPVEAEIDDAIEVFQETKHIRNEMKRKRRHSINNDISNCTPRRNKRGTSNGVINGVFCCKKFLRMRQWPSKCNRYLQYFRNIINLEYSDA